MTPRPKSNKPLKEHMATVRVDEETHQLMVALRDRDGMPFSVQIRRALEMFLDAKGVTKTERPRAVTRKRS